MSNRDKFLCDKCNCLQEAEKQLKIERLPKILIIQLKRFQIVENMQMKKLISCINIPMEIDVKFLLRNVNNSKTKYVLHSIVIHSGIRGDFGHYFTISKFDDENWMIFNDEKCERLKTSLSDFFGNPDENFRYYSPNCAYLLFYEQE